MPPAYIIVATQVLANVANAALVAGYVEKSIASLPFGSAGSLLTFITRENEGEKPKGRRRKKRTLRYQIVQEEPGSPQPHPASLAKKMGCVPKLNPKSQG